MFGGLAGKVAVVTGGAGGLGSAAARRLSAEGCRVVVVVVSVDGGAAIASTVRPSGGAGAWDFASLDRGTYPDGWGRVGEEGSVP